MASQLEICESQAFKLEPKERALLAEHLIASLDNLDDSETERLWVEEAERRYRKYKKGELPARSLRLSKRICTIS